MVEILIPLGSFLMIFGIVYVSVISRHREKMTMLEKGFAPSEFDNKKSKDPRKSAAWLLSIGLGLAAGIVLDNNRVFGEDGYGIAICVLVFMGLGQLIYYYAVRQKNA